QRFIPGRKFDWPSPQRPPQMDCSINPVAAILPSTSGEVLEFFAFDEAYVGRLRESHHSTGSHFGAYFSQLIQIILRRRYHAPEVIEDLKHETFIRVIRSLRS